MGFGYFPYVQGAVDPVIYDASGQQLIALTHTGGMSTMYGAESTTDSLNIHANTVDTYPYLDISGNQSINIHNKAANDTKFYDELTQSFRFKHTAGLSELIGGGVAMDDLKIAANTIDAYPSLLMYGDRRWYFQSATGYPVYFTMGGTEFMHIDYSGTEARIYTESNMDLSLKPNGTGKVRFGTYTAGAASDSTGYITIKDTGGATRKLMVQA